MRGTRRRDLPLLSAALILLGVGGGAALGARAEAQEPLRLRADLFYTSQPGQALLTLQADAAPQEWMWADAMVWTGLDGDLSADALVMVVGARDPEGHGEVRLGRFIATLGALRPLHLDGGYGRVGTASGLALEATAGVPATQDWEDREFDWAVGARVSQRLGDWGSAGVAWLHRRDRGVIADQEVGLDLGVAPLGWLDLNQRLSWDLIYPGIAELYFGAAARDTRGRLEVFAQERSPARILPATSLFAALGDRPSRRLGLSGQWYAAPRLDVGATAAVQLIGDEAAPALSARADLRLDPRGDGAISVEGRREGSADAGWTGLMVGGRWWLHQAIKLSTELEAVLPDAGGERGALWPWGSVALTWAPLEAWEIAGALVASASPEYTGRVDSLVRLTYQPGGGP